MEFFEDKRHRLFTLDERETAIYALFGDEEVAWLEVAEVELEPIPGKSTSGYVLKEFFVKAPFRRAGLGYELLVTAMECFYPLRVPESGSPSYDSLLAKATRKGLLLKTWPQEHDKVEKLRRGRGRIDW